MGHPPVAPRSHWHYKTEEGDRHAARNRHSRRLPSRPAGEPLVGRGAIRERLGRLAPGISRIDFEVRAVRVIDGRVFVERVDEFVYRGRRGAVPVVRVLEVEQGKVKLWREHYDRAQLLREMGVQPAAAAHP